MSNSENQMIGLEVHIQLQGKKLFCDCLTESPIDTGKVVRRSLRLSSGELGKFDRAAMYEAQRSRYFEYRVFENDCLVDVDEEPPHDLNIEALKRAIALSLSLNCSIVDKVTYMRKIVLDGSNTTGFQRTAIVGFNGYVNTLKGNVRISTVCLEEDASRKLSEKEDEAIYSLERLGVPLVEVSTEPDIKDAKHAMETAEAIGKFAILSGWTKKGAEAIRQDVNFSIGHGRVEIKGVQKISLIESCLNYERKRHITLVELSPKLSPRFDPGRISLKDVTYLFVDTKSKTILSGLRSKKKVYATVLPGMSGFLKKGDYRLGLEIADLAKLYGLGGIMHSDELPGYGVEPELTPLKDVLELHDGDGFAILVCGEEKVQIIAQEIKNRISRLLSLDLSETRFTDDEGTTHYLRPLPGRERMYPETDVDVVNIYAQVVNECRKVMPKSEDRIISELIDAYGISRQDATSLLNKGLTESFEELTKLIGDPRLSSRIMNQLMPEINRKINSHISASDLLRAVSECIDSGIQTPVLESALSKHFIDGVDFSDLHTVPELQVIHTADLKKAIGRLITSDPDLSINNLIPKLRSMVHGTFDPKLAINIYREISGRS